MLGKMTIAALAIADLYIKIIVRYKFIPIGFFVFFAGRALASGQDPMYGRLLLSIIVVFLALFAVSTLIIALYYYTLKEDIKLIIRRSPGLQGYREANDEIMRRS